MAGAVTSNLQTHLNPSMRSASDCFAAPVLAGDLACSTLQCRHSVKSSALIILRGPLRYNNNYIYIKQK